MHEQVSASARTHIWKIALCTAGALIPSMVRAEPQPEAQFLQAELQRRTPPNWQVHVAVRDGGLLAFVTPPYQEAFDLWYEPETLRATMLRLCPGPGDSIWNRIGPSAAIVIQPTVGGKSADGMRVKCARGRPTT